MTRAITDALKNLDEPGEPYAWLRWGLDDLTACPTNWLTCHVRDHAYVAALDYPDMPIEDFLAQSDYAEALAYCQRQRSLAILAGVLTVSDAAERHGLDASTVRKVCERGDVPAVRRIGGWIILAEDAASMWGKARE